MELKALRERAGLSQAELAKETGYSEKTIRRWESGEGTARPVVIEHVHRRIREAPRQVPDIVPEFTFIDLFAGIGGLRRGFEAFGGKCIFTSEWDKYAQQTYRANFADKHEIAGDIVQIASEHIPAHDVLLAGFPCQPFSIAGVSKKNSLGRPHGFACETQGTLFFEVARILNHHRPRAFLLENVKNLQTHDGGQTFRVIMHTLREELGYNVFPMVVDARSWVPQHRERILLVGFRDQVPFSWETDVHIPDPADGPRLKSILHPEDGSEEAEPPYTRAGDAQVADRYRLTPHLWKYLQDYAAKHQAKGNGFGYGLVGPDDVARTLSARYYKDGSEILVRTDGPTPRRLTPRECARLMGYDRPGKKPMRIPVSDTQAYRQFGNSVAVPVIEAVARPMSEYLSAQPVRERQLALLLEQSAA